MPRKSTSGTRHGNGQEHGEGWGGGAKGAGSGPAKPFTADSETRQTIPNGKGDPVKLSQRTDRKERDADNAQILKDHLANLALNAKTEVTQVRAAEAWLNRHEGMPVARNINLNVDDVRALSDADLAAEIARLDGASAGVGAGDAAAGVSEKPGNLVH